VPLEKPGKRWSLGENRRGRENRIVAPVATLALIRSTRNFAQYSAPTFEDR